MSAIAELTADFPDVDSSLLDVLLESTSSNTATEDLFAGLVELLPGQALVKCKVLPSGLDVPNCVDFGARILFISHQEQTVDEKILEGIESRDHLQNSVEDTTVLVDHLSHAADIPRVCITDPGGSQTLRCCSFRFSQFGVYELEVFSDVDDAKRSATALPLPVLCVTTTFKLAQDISALQEEVHWGWTGDWTPELEGALLELLVTASEDLRALAGQVGPLMRLFGLEDMDDTVAEVLPPRRRYSTDAIGRTRGLLATAFDRRGHQTPNDPPLCAAGDGGPAPRSRRPRSAGHGAFRPIHPNPLHSAWQSLAQDEGVTAARRT